MRQVIFILTLLISISAHAQMDSLLYERSYALDSVQTGELAVEVDNVSFFKDNEYEGSLVTGYTLPGLWIQPKMTYQPLKNLKMELGLHSIIYAGKIKYPNIAYQDIGSWKGSDYMEGMHLVPFFRANVLLGKVHFVLGNLYGGQNHHLIEPLYSRELNMTCDPEMGLQMLVDLKRWHLDVWCNWQSFIFKGDTHQESFIFGGNSEVKLGKGWTIPTQVVVQHRGGEIQVDSAHHGVQTLINAAIGVRYERPICSSWLKKVTGEAFITHYYQQAGKLWAEDTGGGAYLKALLDFKYGIRLDMNYFRCHNYIPVLGDGHFSCLKVSDPEIIYNYHNTFNIGIEYSRSFAKNYAFGARAEMYSMNLNKSNKMDFNFGVFLKCNPKFILNR